MKRWKILAVMAVLGSIVVIGCDKKSSIRTVPEKINGDKHSTTISIKYAPDKLPAKHRYFVDAPEDGEYCRKIMFSINNPVKSFRYMEIEWVEAGDYKFLEDRTICQAPDFLPEEPIVIMYQVPSGIMMTRGISFVDKNGATRYFLIGESGMDGSLLLIEKSVKK